MHHTISSTLSTLLNVSQLHEAHYTPDIRLGHDHVLCLTLTHHANSVGHKIDLHEFNIVEEGRKALMTSKSPREDLEIPTSVNWTGHRIMEIFIHEIDLITQEQTFHWRASDHIDLTESSNPPPPAESEQKHWDWL